jgi:hypothetical protein
MRTTWPTRAGVVCALLVGLCAAGCGESSSSEAQQKYLIEHLEARNSSTSRMHVYDTLEELLPQVVYRGPSGEGKPLTTAVVRGAIIDVDPGRAFVDGERGSREVAFDDRSADWRTIHLAVEVDEVIGGAVPKRLVVGLSIGGGADPDEIGKGIQTLGSVVLFLGQPTAVFDYDPSVFAMVEGGALLATVSPDGRLHLPVKSTEEEAALLGRTGTLEQLRTAAAAPAREIPVDSVGERVG